VEVDWSMAYDALIGIMCAPELAAYVLVGWLTVDDVTRLNRLPFLSLDEFVNTADRPRSIVRFVSDRIN
jgi:hypothetical protein